MHRKDPIRFTLVVDDFGIKYVKRNDVLKLLKVLKKNYEISTDWSGTT